VSVALPLLIAMLGAVAAAGVLAPVLSGRALPAVEPREPPEASDGSRRRNVAPVIMIFLVVAAAAIPPLSGALAPREPLSPITGRAFGPAPLRFLEARVREQPDDPAARLDLADAYLARDRVGDAVDQYLALVAIDPGSPEAHARLGLVLYRAGRPEEALRALERALEIDPTHPQALYERGVILLRGLDRPVPAARTLRRYLEAAPFGAHRSDARALIRDADRLASATVG
jgi:tetratricopeptide (TPR) repeat protein